MAESVLVVEDDPDLAEALQLILEARGYEVALAANGLEGLDSIASHMPTVIVLDMVMPIMDGWAFARELDARYARRPPILVVSAAENARARAAEIHADAVLAKPFDVGVLVHTVRRLAHEPGAPVGV